MLVIQVENKNSPAAILNICYLYIYIERKKIRNLLRPYLNKVISRDRNSRIRIPGGYIEIMLVIEIATLELENPSTILKLSYLQISKH